MSTTTLHGLPSDLERSFARLSARITMLTLLRGLGRWFTLMVVVIALALISDWLIDWSVAIRTVIFWLIPVIAALGLWKYVVGPLRHSLSPAEKAALIDLHYPDLRERLTATVELSDPDIPEDHKGSLIMRELVIGETLESLPNVDVSQSVPTGAVRRALTTGAVAVTCLLLPFLIRPGHYRLLWSRLLSPAGNFASASNLYFEVENPERVVARGTSVEFTATPRWRYFESALPETVWLNRVDDNERIDRSRMIWNEGAGSYELTFAAVHQGFEYFISAESSNSERFHIQVEDAPEIASTIVEVEPPAYTGKPLKTYATSTGRLQAFERSHVKLKLEFTKPIKSLEFVWDATARSIDAPPPGQAVGDPAPLLQPDVALNEDRTAGTIEFQADIDGPYSLILTDEFGLHNLEDPPHAVSVVRDQPPQVALQNALSEQLEARASDKVEIGVVATDDIGVGELELHFKLTDDREAIISADQTVLGVAELDYRFSVDLARFALKEGDIVTWRVRTADERPIPEPNVVWTSPRALSINNDADPLARADVEKRQEEWRKQLQDLRRQLEANAGLVKDIEKDARKAEQNQEPFQRGDEVPPLADQQWRLAGEMETLSLEFMRHPLFQKLTDVLQQLSREELSPLAEDLKTFAETAAAERPDQLRENARGVEEIARHLKELEEIFEMLAEIEKDLLELDRLGQEAEKLAEKAIDLDRQQQEMSERLAADPSLKENPEFLEQADQLEQQFDAMAADQQRLTDELRDLLDRRPELVDAARQQQIDRLRELAEQARELADPQEGLAQQLEQDAQQLADGAAQDREAQEQILSEQQALLAEADRQADRAAVPPLERRDQRAADQNFREGNLNAAADAQLEFAEELNRLADDLDDEQPLSANPKEALEQLAQREQQIAGEIANLEQENPAPADAREQQRDLARRQEAVQQALEQIDLPVAQMESQQQAAQTAARSGEQLQAGNRQQAAQQAQQAAQQMRSIAQQLPDDLPDSEPNPPAADPAQVAREAQQLADQLEQLQQDTRELARNQTPGQNDPQETREQLQERQQEIAARVEQLPEQIGRFPQQQAMRNLADADERFENQQLQQAAANQQQAQEELEEIAERAQALADSANTPSSGMTPGEVAEQLRQLASRQQQLGQQSQQAAEARAATPEEIAAAAERLADLQRRQEELAGESAELALETARQDGANSETGQQALQAARQADRAAQELNSAQLAQAAQSGQQSAQSSEQLAESAGEQSSSQETAERAGGIAERQQALAEEISQLAQSPAAQQASQQAAQQRLNNATQGLASQFNQAAQRLQSEPFQMNRESGQASQAAQSSTQAGQSMQQSAQNQQASNPGAASQQAQSAAQDLRSAAESVDPRAIPESPVPQEVGQQVTDAFQNLQQAGQLMQQAQSQLGQNSPQPGSEASQQPQDSQSQQSQGQSQNASNQSNESSEQGRQRPGMEQPSPLQQSAQNLQQAAQQLSQAAQQCQNPGSNPGQQPSEPSQAQGSREAPSSPPPATDLARVELELKKLKQRNWGQLPGKLQTEILQSRQKAHNAEYAPLIKRYFEAIAKEQSAARQGAPSDPE